MMRRPLTWLMALGLAALLPVLGGCVTPLGEPRPVPASEAECAVLRPALAAALADWPPDRGGAVYTLTVVNSDFGGEAPTNDMLKQYPTPGDRRERVRIDGCFPGRVVAGVRLAPVGRFTLNRVLWGFGNSFISRPTFSRDGKRAAVLWSQGQCGLDFVVALDRDSRGAWVAQPPSRDNEITRVCVD